MRKIAVLFALPLTLALSARGQDAPSFDDVVNRAIVQESTLLKVLRGERPIAETYIQEMQSDADFGTAPKTDHYFLGKIDFSRGVTTDSFIPNSKLHGFDIFTRLFATVYFPRGFAQTLIIDGAEFDRAHYDFQFVRREFLGQVRTYVIDVAPNKSAGRGRFEGRIWVEDRGFNIVRFNGTYAHAAVGQTYVHFDSWRVNAGPDLWLPYETYSEEPNLTYDMHMRRLRFAALTRVWGYTAGPERPPTEFTNIRIDGADDKSAQAADNSPVESLRAWERQSEDNVVNRLEAAGLLAPRGTVEKVLDQVVDNLIVTNDLQISPEVRARVMLTTPLETFTVGHTIVISRGLLDTLPDEASLAAILSHELAHIGLGQVVDTRFAFSDRTIFDDDSILKRFRFARSQADEDAANRRAVEMLKKSPYAGQLHQPGLFLKQLAAESGRLPNLVNPLFGGRLAEGSSIVRLSALLEDAPQLQSHRPDQIAALPLTARTSLDPWTDELRMVTTRTVPLNSAREKMSFGISPVYLNLRYQDDTTSQLSEQQATPSTGTVEARAQDGATR